MKLSSFEFLKGITKWRIIIFFIALFLCVFLLFNFSNFNRNTSILFTISIVILIIIAVNEIKTFYNIKSLVNSNSKLLNNGAEILYDNYPRMQKSLSNSIVSIRIDKHNGKNKLFLEKFIRTNSGKKMTIKKYQNGVYRVDKKKNGIWIGQVSELNKNNEVELELLLDFLEHFRE